MTTDDFDSQPATTEFSDETTTTTGGPTTGLTSVIGRPRRRRVVLAATTAATVGVAFGGWSVADAVAGGGSTFPTVHTASSSSSIDAGQVASSVENAVVDITTVKKYQDEAAAGTGMVVTSTGDVLTNNHVVDGATSITVKFVTTGKTYAASVLGTDATDDVALLKIAGGSGWPTISAASGVTLGTAVAAIGNALAKPGLPTVTSGTITGTGKSITASDEGSSESLSGLLETDADIVSGDSGGPLVDAAGHVVGMDTAAESTSGGMFQDAAEITSSSDGYAIPIATALRVAGQMAAGKASSTITIGTPGFLGVEVASTTSSSPSLTAAAATVAGVIAGTPAARAGLAQGDEITSVNGKAVASASVLTSTLRAMHAGDRVTIGWTDSADTQHAATVTLATGPAA